MLERLIIAGSGGQGVLLIGKLLANVALRRVAHMTYYPAYGAEVRGGTSNCKVVLSSDEVASPLPERFDAGLLMNQESADSFLSSVTPGGLAIVNGSMCRLDPAPGRLIVPATAAADKLGDQRIANFIMLGAYIGARRPLPVEDVEQGIQQILAGKTAALLELNLRAFRYGLECSEAETL